MVEVNGENSYLGKDIREWCVSNKENDVSASEIFAKYYSHEAKFKPNDNAYYFVEYINPSESYRECGSLSMYGCYLQRDLEKSPRKNRQ